MCVCVCVCVFARVHARWYKLRLKCLCLPTLHFVQELEDLAEGFVTAVEENKVAE